MLPRDHLPNGAGAGWVKWIFFTMGHRGHIPTYKGSDHFSLQLQHQLWAQNWDNTVIYGLVLVYPKSPRPVDFASKSSISSRTSMMVVDHEKSGVSPWEKHEKHWFTQEKKIGKSKMFETKNCKKTTKTTNTSPQFWNSSPYSSRSPVNGRWGVASGNLIFPWKTGVFVLKKLGFHA